MCGEQNFPTLTCMAKVVDPINKNSVFVKFSVSLLAASHNRMFSRSEFIHSFISSTLLLAKVMLVLSAYILGCE